MPTTRCMIDDPLHSGTPHPDLLTLQQVCSRGVEAVGTPLTPELMRAILWATTLLEGGNRRLVVVAKPTCEEKGVQHE